MGEFGIRNGGSVYGGPAREGSGVLRPRVGTCAMTRCRSREAEWRVSGVSNTEGIGIVGPSVRVGTNVRVNASVGRLSKEAD